MKEQKLLLEVSNSKTILVNVINCIQKTNISINEFKAEESTKSHGYISVVVEGEKESIEMLIKQLQAIKGVEHVSTGKTTLPSSEVQNSFEE